MGGGIIHDHAQPNCGHSLIDHLKPGWTCPGTRCSAASVWKAPKADAQPAAPTPSAPTPTKTPGQAKTEAPSDATTPTAPPVPPPADTPPSEPTPTGKTTPPTPNSPKTLDDLSFPAMRVGCGGTADGWETIKNTKKTGQQPDDKNKKAQARQESWFFDLELLRFSSLTPDQWSFVKPESNIPLHSQADAIDCFRIEPFRVREGPGRKSGRPLRNCRRNTEKGTDRVAI